MLETKKGLTMRLIDVLARFGFDPNAKAVMARHASKEVNVPRLVKNGQLEEYQS
jgi:hypothetical protein